MTRYRVPHPRAALAVYSCLGLAGSVSCGSADERSVESTVQVSVEELLAQGEVALWADSVTPASASVADAAAVELGVKFRADGDGTINGIRFYKGSANTGTHAGHLWSAGGSLLGTVTFTGETASGWQTARFASPVAVRANTTYIASYHTDVGHYAANNGFFATSGVNAPPLHALASGVDGQNGVYHYGTSAFPTDSFQSTNYWVDVVFKSTTGGSTTTGTGLTAAYYDNQDLTNLKVTRTDPTVNFNWGSGYPDASIGADTFSVRWTGQVMPQFSQTYTFYTVSDDGVRLSVNGTQIIGNWTDHGPTENSATIALVAGQKYDIRLEYYENGGGATATLSWSSPSQAKQIIPATRLFPSTTTPPPPPPPPPPPAGDTFLPWFGGPAYYGRFSHGVSSSNTYFPIAVWLQSPPNATRYKNAGVNLFVGLWQGPTESQLSALASAGMPTVCDQSGVFQSHLNDTTIRGWLQPDEPDNAQANGSGGYDPCIAPTTIQAGYNRMKANDSTRPVWLGLGRGVADTQWVGRGTCTGRTDMYPEYQKGADILSFDIYPVNEGVPLELVARGVDNLRGWSNNAKPVIADIEASNFDNTTRPSPAQIKSEVWMALVHGAAGIQYFCHRFTPTFSETDCLDNAPTASALASINAQITSLATVLNTQSVANGVTVASSNSSVPVDTMLKRSGGTTYLFAVGMRSGSTTGTFTLARMPATGHTEVVGEGRTLDVINGVFSDSFTGYGVHIYKVTF
jgi:hypothetical protein